MTNPGNVLGVA